MLLGAGKAELFGWWFWVRTLNMRCPMKVVAIAGWWYPLLLSERVAVS